MTSTKELARELGFLRKRLLSSPANKDAKRHKTKQTFDYLVVMDFESTCWSDRKFKTQEIIEFPAVVLDTSTGMVVAEFQQYVMPQECPILSEFCQKLTGISQNQVDNGIPLRLCLKLFKDWLLKLAAENGVKFVPGDPKDHHSGLTTFVTWSDWDLSLCLQNECRRKQLWKPAELNQWIDIRATYKNFYGRKPNGLNGALQELGFSFQGRQHSGLDDARNTAKLAWRMIQDGCQMKVTKTLSEVPAFSAPKKQIKVSMATKDQQNSAAVNNVSSNISTTITTNTTTTINSSTTTNNTINNSSNTTTNNGSNARTTTFNNSSNNTSSNNINYSSTATSTNNSNTATAINSSNPDIINNNSNYTSIKDNMFKQPFPVTDYSGSEKFHKTNLGKSFLQNQPQLNSSTIKPQAYDKNVSTFTRTSSNLGPSSSTDAGSYLPNRGLARGTLGLDPSKSSANNSNVSSLNRSVPSFSAASSFIPSSSKTFTGIKPPTTFSSKPKQFRVYVDSKNSDLDSNGKTVANSHIITSKTNLLQISSNNQELKKQTKINNFCANSSVKHNKENLNYSLSPLHTKDSKNIPVNGSFKERTAVSSICHNSSSKTPQRTTAQSGSNNTSFVNTMKTTPHSGNSNNNMSSVNTMRATPPLCKCGYRAMLRLCQKPGLNMGRCFYSCSVKTRSKVKNKKGVPVNPCDFFKWESPVSPHSSISSPTPRTPSNRFLNSTLPTRNLSSTTNTRLSTTAPFETPKLPKQTIRPCQLIPYQ
ncbi:hypothetical protein Ahia01_001221200 [Argonauta hians]